MRPPKGALCGLEVLPTSARARRQSVLAPPRQYAVAQPSAIAISGHFYSRQSLASGYLYERGEGELLDLITGRVWSARLGTPSRSYDESDVSAEPAWRMAPQTFRSAPGAGNETGEITMTDDVSV